MGIVGLFLGGGLILAFIYLPGYTHMKELGKRKEEVSNEIRLLQQHVKDLSRKNKLVKDKDPYFLEKLAREHLGVVKENEAIVDFTTGDENEGRPLTK